MGTDITNTRKKVLELQQILETQLAEMAEKSEDPELERDQFFKLKKQKNEEIQTMKNSMLEEMDELTELQDQLQSKRNELEKTREDLELERHQLREEAEDELEEERSKIQDEKVRVQNLAQELQAAMDKI